MQACPKEYCLLCEVGFLFRMLRDAHGTNAQATNFTRAFSNNAQATALGLMDWDDASSSTRTSYTALIQTLNRFLLECTASEAAQPEVRLGQPIVRAANEDELGGVDERSPVTQLFGLEMTTIHSCTQCGARNSRDTTVATLDLTYPRKALSNEAPAAADFASIVKASLARETTTKTSCGQCRQPTHLRVRRILAPAAQLPPLLAINAGVTTPEHLALWADAGTGRFLLPRIGVGRSGETFVVTDERDGAAARSLMDDRVVYELRAMVVQIQLEGDPAHLVSIVRIPDAELTDETRNRPWHLFNDFLVRPISEAEALSFPGPWKVRRAER